MSGRGKEAALDQLVRVLDQIPLVSSIKNDLSGLRSLLLNRRPPRIVALGRPGSGRSALLSALIERLPIRDPLHADHGEWIHLEHEGANVHWLEIDVAGESARSQWKAALQREVPDLVFLTLEPNNLEDASRIIARAKSLLE